MSAATVATAKVKAKAEQYRHILAEVLPKLDDDVVSYYTFADGSSVMALRGFRVHRGNTATAYVREHYFGSPHRERLLVQAWERGFLTKDSAQLKMQSRFVPDAINSANLTVLTDSEVEARGVRLLGDGAHGERSFTWLEQSDIRDPQTLVTFADGRRLCRDHVWALAYRYIPTGEIFTICAERSEQIDEDLQPGNQAVSLEFGPIVQKGEDVAAGLGTWRWFIAHGQDLRMCGARRVPLATKQCSRCHVQRYCSADCLRSHWPKHKLTCRK